MGGWIHRYIYGWSLKHQNNGEIIIFIFFFIYYIAKVNTYYFYKWKRKPMHIISLKSENGNSELRQGKVGYNQLEAPKYIIHMKIIWSVSASLCSLG